MKEIEIRGLIGDDGFTQILISLPDIFFKMDRNVQDALWAAVRAQINDGVTDIGKLIKFGRMWVQMYPIVKETVHRAISNL